MVIVGWGGGDGRGYGGLNGDGKIKFTKRLSIPETKIISYVNYNLKNEKKRPIGELDIIQLSKTDCSDGCTHL